MLSKKSLLKQRQSQHSTAQRQSMSASTAARWAASILHYQAELAAFKSNMLEIMYPHQAEEKERKGHMKIIYLQ
jgi:hypothetical protein